MVCRQLDTFAIFGRFSLYIYIYIQGSRLLGEEQVVRLVSVDSSIFEALSLGMTVLNILELPGAYCLGTIFPRNLKHNIEVPLIARYRFINLLVYKYLKLRVDSPFTMFQQ